MKKPIRAKPQPTDELELRRWCVEQAIRWPSIGQYQGMGQSFPPPYQEADVLGRANRLLAWVNSRS